MLAGRVAACDAHAIQDIGALFEPVEWAIRNSFLPSLFGEPDIDGELRALVSRGVKQAGLAIRNPVDSASGCYDVSKQAVGKLVSSMLNA